MTSAFVAAAIAYPAGAWAANTPEGCVRTIIKEAQKFAQKKANSVRKCEDGVLVGKVTGSCPDTKNAEKIAKAETKLTEKIFKKCDTLLVADTGFGTNCPRAACSATLTTIADVADCVACNVHEMVDALSTATYGTLEAPSSDKDVLNCQRTYAKEIIQAFRKVSKAKQKCEDGVLQGKITGPCPDAKAADKIGKTLTKLGEKIGKKCDTPATIDAALNLAKAFGSVGFDGTAASPGAYASALSDAEVQFSLNAPICGNAAIDPGETCDDGNVSGDTGAGPGDTCPSDCVIPTCSPTGSGTATVSFASPAGELITGATLLVYYDASKLAIPGSNNDAQVIAAVSPAGTFTGVTPNDVNYALRAVVLDATFTGAASGDALTFGYDSCAAVAASDFDCFVVDASDDAFAAVDGVTCTVAP